VRRASPAKGVPTEKEIHIPPQLSFGGRRKSHPANYLGCRHTKEEMQKKSQRTPRTVTGRLCSSKLTTLGMSFAAALRSKTEEQQQPQAHQVAGPETMEPRVSAALPQQEQQKADQSLRAPNVNILFLDKMLKVVVTVVQQIMTESNGAVLEEAKILVITQTLLNLVEQNGH
jgi:hypothetical protein